MRDVGIEQMLKKIYTAEFNDNDSSRASENTAKMFINHYKPPFPLRNPYAVFPNNRRMAESRLKNFKKRFIKDKQYLKDYSSFMEDVIKKGYAGKSDPKAYQEGKTWFIPHHGVYHPSKPGKIRIVFDCIAEWGFYE